MIESVIVDALNSIRHTKIRLTIITGAKSYSYSIQDVDETDAFYCDDGWIWQNGRPIIKIDSIQGVEWL